MNDIFVDDLGEGHAFIFVHGFLGSSEMWSLQKDYFKSKYRIVSPAMLSKCLKHLWPYFFMMFFIFIYAFFFYFEDETNSFHLKYTSILFVDGDN